MTFFSAEMMMLDINSTKVVAAPIPRALPTEVVTANVGQQPNTKIKVGFSLKKPLVNIFNLLLLMIILLYFHKNIVSALHRVAVGA